MKRGFAAVVFLLLLLAALHAGAETEAVGTKEELYRMLRVHTERAEESFAFMCSGGALEAWENRETIRGFLTACGVEGYELTSTRRRDAAEIRISRMSYMAGTRILAYYRAGREEELPVKEQAALAQALDIVRAAAGEDPERELAIHDALCARITYYTDDTEGNDDDSAVGALVNGLANCDGYADAFFLCGRLAGLEVLYFHGEGLTETQEDPSHMWNLIRLGDSWLMTDVTWDDAKAEEGGWQNFHLWYNLGTDRMGLDHSWPDNCREWISPAASAPESAAPAGLRFTAVSSWEEAENVIAAMESGYAARIGLLDRGGLGLKENSARLNAMIRRYGCADYRWAFSPDAAEILCLGYTEGFAFCRTAEEAVARIDALAGQNPPEIRLGFPAELARQLFAEDHRGIWHVICMSRLDVPVTFTYSSETGYVEIRSPAYTDRLRFAGSGEELQRVLAEELSGQPESLQVEMTAPFDVQAAMAGVYRYGVESFSVSTFAGERLIFSDIRYYSRFRILGSTAEIPDYLRQCAREGAGSFRIYLPEADYASLAADNCSGITGILRECGVSGYTLYYSGESCSFTVEGAAFN